MPLTLSKRRAAARTYFLRKMQVAADTKTPEGKLAVAVITRAYLDHDKLRAPEPDPFLMGEWGSLPIWCGIAGLDMEYVKETYMKCYDLVNKKEEGFVQ